MKSNDEIKQIGELINYISDTIEEKYGIQSDWFHDHLEQIALAARRIAKNKRCDQCKAWALSEDDSSVGICDEFRKTTFCDEYCSRFDKEE